MIFKDGVKIFGARPEIVIAIITANEVYKKNGKQCVITSVTEGKHSVTSLHYAGCAFDLRVRHLDPGQDLIITQDLKDALTDEYDVLLEVDHIHVEFQPKRTK